MASDASLVSFKEFSPLYYVLNAIPTKIQKSFRSVVVYLTALDANKDYIAVGSSIGMLYLYCRRFNQMNKYNLEGKTESITVVKLLSCFDDLVAVGTASGRVTVFQLVSLLPGRNKQLRKFDVVGIHKTIITALAWSANGMKLFSGDVKGKVVYSALDVDQGLCTPVLVLEEPSPIVQLDYSQKILLASTNQCSMLYYCEEKMVKQVGSQPRKSNGKFGACFIPGLCKQSDLTLYAVRPGLRLWKSDAHGTVQATYILKDMFAGGVNTFELYPRSESPTSGGYRPPERCLGLVTCFFQEGCVLSWNEYSIYVVDLVNQTVIGGLEGPGDIVSVSCTDNEIFLLKGERDIIRISNKPEGLASAVPDTSPRVWSPLAAASSPVMSTAFVETAQKIRTIPVLPESATGSSRDDAGVPLLSVDSQNTVTESEKIVVEREDTKCNMGDSETRKCFPAAASESRSRSNSVNSCDSGSSQVSTVDKTSTEISTDSVPSSQRFSMISDEEFNQKLVVRSIKVKKKRKKNQENGNRKRGISSSESTPSYDRQLSSDHCTIDFLSDRTSLLSSSADQLNMDSPDRDSIISYGSHGIIQDDSLNALCPLQFQESFSRLGDHVSTTDNILHSRNLNQMHSSNSTSVVLSSADFQSNGILESVLPSLEQREGSVQSSTEELGINGKLDYIDNTLRTTLPCGLHGPSAVPDTVDEMEAVLTTSGECEDGAVLDMVQKSNSVESEELDSVPVCVLAGGSETEPKLHEDQQEKDLFQKEVCKRFSDDGEECVLAKVSINTHDPKAPRDVLSSSGDEDDIYGSALPHSLSETSVTEGSPIKNTVSSHSLAKSRQEEEDFLKSDQFAESWMGYSGPGYGILSLVVSEKYIWCLDFKGNLYCSPLPSAGLRWQKFEEGVQQVAVSPTGTLLWKVEQKSNKAFACGKVTIKGKRHWYEALSHVSYVALSDDTAWIIRTNGDVYLQTGLSIDRPCSRAVKIESQNQLSQIACRNNVVWALTDLRTVIYREGVSSYCTEGEQWISDPISEKQGLELVCIALGDHQTAWALDTNGNLWFRTGVTSKNPQGEDEHWWQVSITDYVVFDQNSLFQTIIQATQTVANVAQAPVERVADKLRVAFSSVQPSSQPSLISINSGGVWITSGKNEFHVAKGNLIGTFWKNIVPHGTAAASKWRFVLASTAPAKKGNFLWLGQSNKDLFCIDDQNPYFRPSTVQLPPETEMVQFSACRDAIWALDTWGRAFIRTLSTTCPTGMHWTKLDLAQLGAVTLVSLSCGSEHIWACDTNGLVYFRVGTQPLNPSMMLPAWITIEPPELPIGMHLVSLHSSPNDRMLWTIDNKGNVHVRLGITDEMPVGTNWEQVPGLQASQLTVSSRTVWVRCPNGDIARRYGITDKNPAGDYWKKVPGNMTCLTATSFDELWAVDPAGSLLQRLTKTFRHCDSSAKPSIGTFSAHSEDFEDEWEVI
ncbi:tectonin beta-propeller repeat-containing protein 2 [Protopterus annectens]|uniref:tectonin beta-propeller repeat-containing protein 2 n=1 Tax=Protopterus annectens TaxID=7888 RepID=UPI001CFA6F97|nr:tectonin beta-propeller repeat-containing protein 2 [Protopterus annectens]